MGGGARRTGRGAGKNEERLLPPLLLVRELPQVQLLLLVERLQQVGSTMLAGSPRSNTIMTSLGYGVRLIDIATVKEK